MQRVVAPYLSGLGGGAVTVSSRSSYLNATERKVVDNFKEQPNMFSGFARRIREK